MKNFEKEGVGSGWRQSGPTLSLDERNSKVELGGIDDPYVFGDEYVLDSSDSDVEDIPEELISQKLNTLLKEYKKLSDDMVELKYRMALSYFADSGRWLDFRKLDKILCKTSPETDLEKLCLDVSMLARDVSPKRMGIVNVGKDNSQQVFGVSSQDMQFFLNIYYFLTDRKDIDAQLLEMAILSQDFHYFIHYFFHVTDLKIWVSVISKVDSIKACPRWAEKVAESIGQKKNACDCAFRKCKNVKVLLLCQKMGIKLYPLQKDVLSKASVC